MKSAALIAFFVCAAAPAMAANCEELAKLALPNATISKAEAEPAGTFQPPVGPALPNLPAFCRVELVLKPSGDSHIEAEVWLPASGWNGKFQGIGNGGFAGSLIYRSMDRALEANYAVFETLIDELTRVFNVGRYIDRIIHEAGQLKFAEKHCVYDSLLVPNSLIYPL